MTRKNEGEALAFFRAQKVLLDKGEDLLYNNYKK
jgi:hypothetical protein